MVISTFKFEYVLLLVLWLGDRCKHLGRIVYYASEVNVNIIAIYHFLNVTIIFISFIESFII